MLVAGKFSRFAAAAAILAPIFLAVDLLTVRSAARSLLIANTIDLAVLILATLCAGSVARRCIGSPRQLWILLALAFGLETVGQALSSYYQSFNRAALAGAVPSDIFFFVWAAPIFMIFLGRGEEDSAGFDALRILDFLQVAIVALSMYFYFFYSASAWRGRQLALIHKLLAVYLVRDILLVLGFYYLRSRASKSGWFRSFCGFMALVFVMAAASDGVYIATFNPAAGAVAWGDLIWMLPYLLVIFFALSWRAPESPAIASPAPGPGRFFVRNNLPIALPLVVIFMAQAIARQRFALAWLAVTVSVLCSSARLVLTNRRTRRVAEHLLSTEKALRISEQMLSSAFRESPDAFSINIFPDGPYLDVNEGFTRLTGYTREETLGKTPSQMNLWADNTERDEVLSQLTRGPEVRDIEFCFRTKSGQMRFGQMSICLMELESRTCSLVVVRDITARKEAEDVLRTSEERFRSLVQNLHVGIVTYSPEGKILFANQAAVQFVRLPLEQVLGKTVPQLGLIPIAEDGSVISQDRRPTAQVIATGKPVRNMLIGWRHESFSHDMWTLLDAVPEFAANGELLRVVVSFTDVTEHRRADAALRESEERFRTLVNELHVAVFLHGPDGRVEFANPAALRMFDIADQNEIFGKHPAEAGYVTLAEDGSVLREEQRPVAVVIRTRLAMRNVFVGLQRASGKVVWVFGSSVPHLDSSGKLVRVITSFMDMTEHRRAASALRESEERFRTLVGDLHIAVVLHRPDGSIEFANPAAYRMFNVPDGSATGKLPSDYGVVLCDANGDELPEDAQPVPTAVRTRTAIPNGLLAIRRAGSDRILWVFGNVVPQFDAAGNVIRLITSFADVSEMKNAERAIHNLSTQLLRLQDEERRRLGRELHDGLAQTVLAINLSLAQVRGSLDSEEHRATKALEKARALTQQMSREIRTLSYLLHPPLLDELGLVSALREYAHGFTERSSIDTQLRVLSDFRRLPASLELALFRIVQESLANIQRHSGSTTATIRLSLEDSFITLEITDTGHGMAMPVNGTSTPGETRLGVGIPGMRERISQLGGHLEIISGSSGTTIRATIALSDLKIHDQEQQQVTTRT